MCLGFTKSGGGLQLFFLHVLTKYAVSADVPKDLMGEMDLLLQTIKLEGRPFTWLI